MSLLLGSRTLILHHAVLGVHLFSLQCPTDHILTHQALHQLMMMIPSITTINENIKILIYTSNTEELSENKSKIPEDVRLHCREEADQ